MASNTQKLQHATACFNAGQFDTAKALCIELLRNEPVDVEVLHLSGIISAQAKNFTVAADLLYHAINLAPDNAQYHSSLGNVLFALQRPAEALAAYDKAILLKSDYAQAYTNRGNVLVAVGRTDEALLSYERAVALLPEYAQGHYSLAALLVHLQRLPEALARYSELIALQPENPLAHHHRAIVYRALHQTQAAIDGFETVLSIAPDDVVALVNLGNERLELQQVDAAMVCYEKAIAFQPDLAEAQWNRALILLMQGHLKEGWKHYEWRWKKPEFMAASFGAKIPLWHAQAPRPRNLYIWAEQGVGDEVMFGALLPQSLQLADHVTVHVDPRLVPLFKRSMPDVDIQPKQALAPDHDFDARLPMGSLAREFCNSPMAFRAIASPFLKADPARVQSLKNKIHATQTEVRPLVCGLSWTSNALTGQARSIELTTLLSAIDAPGLQFVSLQYGEVQQDVADVRHALGTQVHCEDSVDNFNDLDGLAALIDACDLVISIDNSTAHMAGALGKPTWLLLPFAANWRWGLNTRSSTWYPTMKLYRQDAPLDWGEVFAQVRKDLELLLLR